MSRYSYNFLLTAYRQIWKNRLLEQADLSDENVIKESIKRELLDENSHPRIRTTVEKKFLLATKRIIESSLSNEEKVELIKLHIEILNELN